MTYEDPPSPRAVVRGVLGGATLLAAVALVALVVASGHVEWKLAGLVMALWAAYSFFDSLFGVVVEPLGRLLVGQLSGDLPGGPTLTIEQETARLEQVLADRASLPAHRVVLAGIRLVEIYRTHEHDAAKAAALVARLATQYPDAPELRYVRPPTPD